MAIHSTDKSATQLAVISVISAYFAWGGFGLFFKALDHVSPTEILVHRIIWSALLLCFIITIQAKWSIVRSLCTQPKTIISFFTSAILISLNWGFYIYAVVSGQALEGSMGYFFMPLVVVALGALFFGERFNRLQTIAIICAALGVAYQIATFGQVPWIALILAFSFGFYGVVRKKSPADSIVGLFLETMVLSPLALIYLLYLNDTGELMFLTSGWSDSLMMMMAGPVTALPLILFAYGARTLRYSTVGLLQYINPTCQFLLAVYVFNEDFSLHNLVTFAFIWIGLGLYSYSVWRQSHQRLS